VTHIPNVLRRLVEERAGNRCEYCLLHSRDFYPTHEVDHIYAEKHGGETIESNLCLSCYECNRFKGSDLASLDPQTGEPVFLFHPRRDIWLEHFHINRGHIEPLTSCGRATARLLQINTDERVEERARLAKIGQYP
jgi:hypothetical protein